MESSKEIREICQKLSEKTQCDFVGLALFNPVDKELRWNLAIGNQNDKWKRIVVRYGKGIAGQVVRSGQLLIVSSFPDQIVGKITDYPIMLAEQLKSAIAAPIFAKKIPWGALLIGNRSLASFTKEHKTDVKESVREIEKIVSDQAFQTKIL